MSVTLRETGTALQISPVFRRIPYEWLGELKGADLQTIASNPNGNEGLCHAGTTFSLVQKSIVPRSDANWCTYLVRKQRE
jgi:hypothetical protein